MASLPRTCFSHGSSEKSYSGSLTYLLVIARNRIGDLLIRQCPCRRVVVVRRFRRGPRLIKRKGERHKHNGRLPFTRSNNRNISTFRKGREVEIQSLASNLRINKRPTLGFDFRTSLLVKLEKPAWPEHIQNTAFWPDNVLYICQQKPQ